MNLCRFMSAATATAPRSNNIDHPEEKSSKPNVSVDEKLEYMNRHCQRNGRIFERDMKELFSAMTVADTLSSNQALFALRCCGDLAGMYRVFN